MRRFFQITFALAFSGIALAPTASHATAAKVINFQAEGWADNWFSLYIDGKKVGEDSVPITIVKSFNSTKIKFSASYPFTVGVVIKDYKENASGLEYIGQPNQQIGDGGFSLQIRDLSSNKIIATTSSSWKLLVVNKAPLNPSCVTSSNPIIDCKSFTIATPINWSTKTFNDSKWTPAYEYTPDEVGVKDGYFDIVWSPSAKLIWSSDLKLDNIVLLRSKISEPTISQNSKNLAVSSTSLSSNGVFDQSITCDGKGLSPQVTWDGYPSETKAFYVTMDTIPGPLRPGEVATSDHSYFNLYNIPTNVNSLQSGSLVPGILGMNFKNNKPGYEPPCSQGPGAKIYTITVYALSSLLNIPPATATQKTLMEAMAGKVLAQGKLSGSYSRI